MQRTEKHYASHQPMQRAVSHAMQKTGKDQYNYNKRKRLQQQSGAPPHHPLLCFSRTPPDDHNLRQKEKKKTDAKINKTH